MNFKIKEARKLAGLSQGELAAKIGVARNTLSGYENGQHDPRSDVLKLIAAACGVTVDFLLGREEQKEKTPTEIGKDLKSEVLEQIIQLTPDELDKVLAFVQGILATH